VEQHYGLFPWFSVEKNVALGLRLRGIPRRERNDRVIAGLTELGLADKARSLPGELSGGEKQRVALARTIAADPNLLLLDEPFSALDAFTREELQQTLLMLHHRHHRSTLLVTHSLEEAVFVADRIGIMHGSPAGLTTVENPWRSVAGAPHREDRSSRRFGTAVAGVRRRFGELQRAD
jgi:ABC-type nitrate/sulfonate/bicarbonate transport system ATPase subunit